jgi:hypothetical protein
MIVVFYTLALFKVSSLQIMRVIEHLAPRLIQDILGFRLFVLSHCPNNPNYAGDPNQYDYNLRYGENGCVRIHDNLLPSNNVD